MKKDDREEQSAAMVTSEIGKQASLRQHAVSYWEKKKVEDRCE